MVMASEPVPHVVIFPFMSQGHTIPLLRLALLLRSRRTSVTVFTTPANSPHVRAFLAGSAVSVISFPFPTDAAGLPPGVESTDMLPSMSLFVGFANATKLMQPHFEQALRDLLPVTCIISDGFLGWSQQSAAKFGVPRLVSYGMSLYATCLCHVLYTKSPHADVDSDDEPFAVPSFPWVKLTKNDIEPPFNEVEPKGEFFDFVVEQRIATSLSHGLVVNSFYELEPRFHDYWNREIGPKAWCIGPLCLVDQPKVESPQKKSTWVQWLDKKFEDGRPVLYVAFGTQAKVCSEQLHEIAVGLERSSISFLWVLRSSESLEFLEGFVERVKDRGVVVKEWVNQMEILKHKSVNGFFSHCGWNSVMESICAGVPILALPLIAEQHLNARMVAEEIRVGLRVMANNGSVRGLVKTEEIEKKIGELMSGEGGKEVRKRVREAREAAFGAMESGSSSRSLDQLMDVLGCRRDN